MAAATLPEEKACGCADTCLCLPASIAQIVGRKYSLLLLSLLADRGAVRFNEIKSALGEISSSTLTTRLAELEAAGLLARRVFAELPPRVEYALTEAGAALRKELLALSRAAARQRNI